MNAVNQAIRDGLVVTQRNLIKIKRVPDLLIFSTIQPIMFVLLFAYVFGSAIELPGVNYREFLMAGIFTQTVAFGSALTSIGLAEDLQKGIIDRFRSLPMSRAAVLVGRTTSDLVNNAFVVVVMSVCGLLVGWRIRSSVPEAVAGFALLLLFAFAMSWVSALIGLSVRSVEVAQSAGFIWLFPLTFVSSAFVPTDNMPTVLRKIAEWNPVTAVATGCRDLWGNTNEDIAPLSSWPQRHAVFLAVAWSVALLAVFVPWSVRRYRAAASR
jgi:ABC-type multidrug transport system permease subunit